jgi:hypothetical protein
MLLDEPKRSHHVRLPHAPYRANCERSFTVGEVDHDDTSRPSNVDVGRPVLARRQEDAHVKTVDIQDGRHWNVTYQLGLGA